MVSRSLELADADAKLKVVTALAEVEKKEADLNAANKLYKLELDQKYKEETLERDEAIKAKLRAAAEAENKAKADLQEVLAAINDAEIARKKALNDAEIAHAKELAKIEEDKQKAYANTVKEVMTSVSPDLIAALTAKANADILTEGMKSMSPYAIANNEEISETVDRLLRGTPLEGMLAKMMTKEEQL